MASKVGNKEAGVSQKSGKQAASKIQDSLGEKSNSYREETVSGLSNVENNFFLSRDRQIKWMKDPVLDFGKKSRANIVKLKPGPTAYATVRARDIKSTFLLFFPPVILNKVVKMTNLEGRRVFGEKWENLLQEDLLCYMGVALLAGVFQSRNETATSLWDEKFGRPIFCSAMSLRRFLDITRVIRFDDKSTRAERRAKDKLAPIRDIWEQWASTLPKAYNPGENLLVGEQLVAFRGRCPFRQYIPSKPAKYGIKIWMACDCRNSYAWSMRVCTGEKREKNQSMRVALDLTRGFAGHNITCHNFFTSYALGRELLKKNITMLGPVKKNKLEVPPELLLKREVNSSLFGFTCDATIMSYTPKKTKNVLLMSTLHNECEISNRTDKKPKMLMDYNITKGGIDSLDKQISKYTCRRKTKRWPMVLFSNMLDVSAYNAFVIWKDINPDFHKNKLYRRRLFLEELGYELIRPSLKNRAHQPRLKEAREIIQLAKSEDEPSTSSSDGTVKKRRRCYKCPRKCDNKHKDYCTKCDKCICKNHLVSLCVDCAKS